MRALRRFFFWMVGIFVLLLGIAVALAVAYEDDVKKELLSALNDQLRCKIDVDKIELTLIERFPNASLKFSNIVAYEAIPDKVFPDTLLFAEQLYLEFSLFDLIGNSYTVKNISLRNAKAQLVVDPNGEANYNIWKGSETESSGSAIELEKVLLENVELAFIDSTKAFHSHLFLQTATVSAELKERMHFEVRSELKLALLRIGKDTLAVDRQLALDAEFAFDKQKALLEFERSKLVLGKIPLYVEGKINTGKDPKMDLTLSGERLSIEELRALLPTNMQKNLEPYGLVGMASIEGKLTGPFGNGNIPVFNAEYELADVKMTELTTNTVFDRIDAKGRFVVNKEKVDLYISEAKARSGPGIAHVKGWVKDLNSPEFGLDISAEMDLVAIQRFFRIDTLEKVDGDLVLQAKLSGKLADPSNISRKDLKAIKVSGQVELSDATLKLKGRKNGLEDLNGVLILHNNDAAIQDLSATLAGSDMELNGFFRNLLPHLLVPGERLAIEAQFYSELTDLNGLLESKTNSKGEEQHYHLELPANIDLNLNAQIDKLIFREFSATDISGIIRLANKKLFADPVTFTSSGGQVLAQLVVNGTEHDVLPLSLSAKVQNIQIDRLFREFENFGQDFIRAEHLKGTATADVTYKATLKSDLHFDLDNIYCMIDISIENGQLIEHAPMVEIAQYVRKNKLIAPFVKVKEFEHNLRNIHFSKLENQIEIKDRTVYIPSMMINTSAIDIEVAGSHTFDGYMDHHINFRMSDLLRTGKKENDEFGVVVDDGTGSRIYLHMYGPANNLQIDNDRDAIKLDRKEYLAKEKQQFKSILKEEFGLFKKDTALVFQENDLEKPTFIVEWDESDTLKTDKKPDNKKKKKKSWLDKLVLEDPDGKETFDEGDDDDF